MSISATPQRTYQAFISYRHADNTSEGRQWATWLHQAIETYQVPDELVGKTNSRGEEIPERIFPIFRDEDELPADADLGNSIANALKASRLLIVVCSPNAVASTYVADEIDYFKLLGHSDRIIAMIIDGEPNVSWDTSKHKLGFSASQECFPEPLQFRYDDNGNRTAQRAEPIAADFRVFHGGQPQQAWTSQVAYRQQLKADGKLSPAEIDSAVKRYGEQQNLMLLKIIAGILGVPLGELTQRDKAYQLALAKQRAKRLRQWLAAVGVLAMVAIGAGIWAYVQQQVAEQQRDTALISQSRFLLNQAELQAQDGYFDDAILLGLNALPGLYGGDRPWVNELAGIRMGMQQNNKLLNWQAPKAFTHAQLIANSDYFAVGYDDGLVDIVELTTGKSVAQLQHGARIDKFEVSPKGQFIALKGRDSRLTIWRLDTFAKVNDIAMRGWPETVQFNAEENAVYTLNYPGYIAKYALSDDAPVYETKVVESAQRLVLAPNGKYVATADLFGLNAHVFDAQTGQLMRAIPAGEDVYSSIIREPRFNPLNNDILLVYSSAGTHSYAVTSDESGLAAGYHMLFDEQGDYALMLTTGQRVESGIQEADALNSLAKSPVVINVKTSAYVALEHGIGPELAEFGHQDRVYTSAADDIYVWDKTTGQHVFSFKAPDTDEIDIEPQQQRALTWQRGTQQLALYSLQSHRGNIAIPTPYSALGRSLSDSGNWLLVMNETNKNLAWLNTQTNVIEAETTHPCERLWRDTKIIYASDESQVAVHCDRKRWIKLSREAAQSQPFTAETVAPSAELAATLSNTSTDAGSVVQARIFNWLTAAPVTELHLPVNSIYDVDALSITQRGDYLIVNRGEAGSLIIDSATNATLQTIVQNGEVTWLAEPKLAFVRSQNSISLWQPGSTEAVWQLTGGNQYDAATAIANGAQVLIKTSGDELLWLDVRSKRVVKIIKFSGYNPKVREYSQHDLVTILGYGWQSWRVSDHTLIDQSRDYQQTTDIAFSASTNEWVRVSTPHSYSRYRALLDITVEQAQQSLPIGKRCLSDAQRARYYLPELTTEQRQQRGCE